MRNFRFTYYLFVALWLGTRISSATDTLSISIYDDFALRNQCLQDSGDAQTIAFNFYIRNEELDLIDFVGEEFGMTAQEVATFLNTLKDNPSFIKGIFSDEVAEKLARYIVHQKLGLGDNELDKACQVGWRGWPQLWIRKCKVLLGKQQVLPEETSTDVDNYITMVENMHPLLAWYALKWYQKYAEAQYVSDSTDKDPCLYLLQQLEKIEKKTYHKRKDFVACIHASEIDSFANKEYRFGSSRDDINKKNISLLYKESCFMLGINDLTLTPNEKKGIKMLGPYHSFYYFLFIATIFIIVWLVIIVGKALLQQLEESVLFFEAHPELETPQYLILYKKIKKSNTQKSELDGMNQFML